MDCICDFGYQGTSSNGSVSLKQVSHTLSMAACASSMLPFVTAVIDRAARRLTHFCSDDGLNA